MNRNLIFLGASILMLASCGGGEAPASETEMPAAPVSSVDTKSSYAGLGVGKYTSVDVSALTEVQIEAGRAVFDSKCLACHEVSDVKKVGPGLSGITKRRTPVWILNMITNPVEMTQKDPMAKQLYKETLAQMTFQDVSDAQAHELLAYLIDIDNVN